MAGSTNPERAAYNRVHNRTTVVFGKGCAVTLLAAAGGGALLLAFAILILRG